MSRQGTRTLMIFTVPVTVRFLPVLVLYLCKKICKVKVSVPVRFWFLN